MSTSTHPFASSAGFLRALRQHSRRVLVPAVSFATLVAVYAAVKSDTWEATQPLVFRNEAAGNQEALGKFRKDARRALADRPELLAVLGLESA